MAVLGIINAAALLNINAFCPHSPQPNNKHELRLREREREREMDKSEPYRWTEIKDTCIERQTLKGERE